MGEGGRGRDAPSANAQQERSQRRAGGGGRLRRVGPLGPLGRKAEGGAGVAGLLVIELDDSELASGFQRVFGEILAQVGLGGVRGVAETDQVGCSHQPSDDNVGDRSGHVESGNGDRGKRLGVADRILQIGRQAELGDIESVGVRTAVVDQACDRIAETAQ